MVKVWWPGRLCIRATVGEQKGVQAKELVQLLMYMYGAVVYMRFPIRHWLWR